MGKEKITIEYQLAATKPAIAWSMISTAAGLQKWLADEVKDNGDTMTFTWGVTPAESKTITSDVVARKKNRYIRLHWQEDEAGTYWEMKLEESELTGQFVLVVTDFADADDLDFLHGLWNDNIDRLHRATGL